MAKQKIPKSEIYCVRCGRIICAADPGGKASRVGGLCPGGCAGGLQDCGPVNDPIPGRREEPAWAAEVRANLGEASPAVPLPASLVEANLGPIKFDAPFVELTLVETGRYTGPTRGRVCHKEAAGFDFLTEKDGVFFIAWSNLAFWRYLVEI